MTVQMNHGTGGVVTLQAPASGSGTVTIPAVTGIIAGPRVSFSTDGTILSSYGVSSVSRVSTGIYDITRTVAAVDANYGAVSVGFTSDVPFVTLDASNDYITASSLAALSGQTAFTVFVRVRINSTLSQSCGLFQQRASSSALSGMRLFTDALAYIYHDSEATNYASLNSSASGFVVGSWVTVAIVYDGTLTGNSNRLKVFVDNTQASLTFTGSIGSSFAANAGAFEVGRWNSGGSFTYGNVSISRAIVYGSALNTTQLTTLHEGGATGSPVLRWEFSDGTGTTVTDSSGNSRNGTLTNGPTWSTASGAALVSRIITGSRTMTNLRVAFYSAAGTLTDPIEASVAMVV